MFKNLIQNRNAKCRKDFQTFNGDFLFKTCVCVSVCVWVCKGFKSYYFIPDTVCESQAVIKSRKVNDNF